MYYLRRFIAQLIDAFVLVLLGAAVFSGTEYSPIATQGHWYTCTPSPMYPEGGFTQFRVSLEEGGQEDGDREGYRLFQCQLMEGLEISLIHYPRLGWPLVLVFALYYTWCTARWGQTVGKWLMRLRVERIDGGRVACLTSLGRWLAYYVSGLPLYLGLVWIFFDRRSQGWHDRICKTRVVSSSDRSMDRSVWE